MIVGGQRCLIVYKRLMKEKRWGGRLEATQLERLGWNPWSDSRNHKIKRTDGERFYTSSSRSLSHPSLRSRHGIGGSSHYTHWTLSYTTNDLLLLSPLPSQLSTLRHTHTHTHSLSGPQVNLLWRITHYLEDKNWQLVFFPSLLEYTVRSSRSTRAHAHAHSHTHSHTVLSLSYKLYRL